MKRIIIMILITMLLFGSMPLSAFSSDWGVGDTIDSALSELKVGFEDTLLDWLVLPNLGVIKQRYSYFMFKNERTGMIEEHPVYCIDPTKGGAYSIVTDIGANSDGSRTATYIRGDKVGDARYKAIIASGYPHMKLNSLGLLTKQEGYYATKLALWMYIRGNDAAKLSINPAYGNTDPVALRVRDAAIAIYNNSTLYSAREPRLTLTGKPSATANLDVSGTYYVQGVEVVASGWVGLDSSACGDVQLSWSSPPPAGTIVLGTDGEDISSALNVKMTGQNDSGWLGSITIKYPASAINPETFSPPTLNAEAILTNDEIYVAYAKADRDKYQRYLVERDPKILVTASFVSQLGKPYDEDFPSDTGLRIKKLETGTLIPLSGAVFEIKSPDGKLLYSLATPESGVIDIPLSLAGNYTVTEVSPPRHHLLPENRVQSIYVRYGEIAEVTFTDEPYGTLRVIKRDASNGRPLVGAAVRIRSITSNTVREGYSDSSGYVVFEKLPTGAWEITELISPDGYVLDQAVHTVNVLPLSMGETSFTLTNKAYPGLRIIKFDSQTMTPIDGVTFEVLYDGELLGIYVTDMLGEIELRNQKPGTYTVREIATRSPYVLDMTVQQVELKAGQGSISELVFLNRHKPGIRIIKVDSSDMEPLAGAVFAVSKVGGSFCQEFTSSESGEIELSSLEPGTYQVIEKKAPESYLADDNIRTIMINPDENAAFVFTNTKKPSLIIRKYDEDTALPLEGAEFSVAQKGGAVVYEGVTPASGMLHIKNLEPGMWYTVTELAAPKGYLKATEYKDVYLEPGRTLEIKFDNRLRPALRLVKVDSRTGKPLAGARFRVQKTEDATVSEYITGETGTVTIYDLDESVYSVWEYKAPYGYLLDGEHKDIKLEWGKIKTLVFDNNRKPVLIFLKTNALTGKGIPGATFRVEYEMPGGSILNIGSFKTGADGRIVIPLVNPGWYIFTETLPAPGFALPKNPVTRIYAGPGDNAYLPEFDKYYNADDENKGQDSSKAPPATDNIKEHSGSEYYVQGEGFNWPLNSVVIKKTHAITGELLAGAAFELYRADEQVSGIPGTAIGRYTTDNSGIVVITGLEPGYYIVKEVQAPQNFLISENSQQNGYLKPDGTTVLEFTFANYPYGSLLITKADAKTGVPLAGARFKVTTSDGALVGNTGGEYTTDSKGEILIPNLKPGSYIITELTAPDGYALTSLPQTISIGTDGKTYTTAFTNEPLGSLVIRKLDSKTKQPLAGAQFMVTTADCSVVGTSNGIFVTDSTGIIEIPNLARGSYVIKEIKAPDGYVLENKTQTIYVSYGLAYTVTVENSKMSGVQIIKIDMATKQPLKDAQFTLYKKSGEIVGSFKTNGEGVIILDMLEPGWYKAVESKAPDGYIIDDTPQDFLVTSNQFIKLIFENKQLSSLQIRKECTSDGSPLAGAVFEIRKQNGEYTGEYTTGKDGAVSIPGLMPGWYTVSETKAPQGYILDSTAKTVEVKPVTPTVVRFTNRPLAGLTIIKLDSVKNRPIEGVQFTVSKMNGERVENEFRGYTFTTGSNGQIFIPDLTDGYYIVTETKAADGYILDGEPKTVLIKSGNTTLLEVFNTPQTGLRICKIDSVTKKPIYGVEFMVFDANNKVVGNLVTDNNGIIDFDGITAGGRYTIRETRPAEGYYRDDMPRTVEFMSGKITEVVWENTPCMGQVQITKLAGDDNEVNGLEKGTPLAGAVFEIYSYKSGNLMDRFVSGTDGRAVSKPLPLGRYTVKEVQAPRWYKLSSEQMDIEIEFATQIIRREFINYSANTGVRIRKVGSYEAMPGNTIRYDIKEVANTSTVPLTDFFWRDIIPTDAVRLEKIVTGTYSQALKYKILAQTNKGDTRIIADNLSTTISNVIDCRPVALGLAGDEYVKDFTLVFGTVKAGFCLVTASQVFVTVKSNLPNGYQFANKADVGGKYYSEWVISNSTWVTTIYAQPTKLPRTGY